MSVSGKSLEAILNISEMENPGGAGQASILLDPVVFEATRRALKSNPMAAGVVEFFDNDPVLFRVRGVSYFAERPDAEA